MRGDDSSSSVIKALHLEYLVTKQVGTGNGEAWIPQGADWSGVPRKFKGEDLGLAFDHGPSIFSNTRGLEHKNADRRHKAVVGEHERLAREAKALGVKPKGMQPDPVGCGGCASCAPSARKAYKPRREQPHERWWRPSNPNRNGRREANMEAAMGESRNARPIDAETRRRQLRARAKAAGIVVRDGQLVREGTE